VTADSSVKLFGLGRLDRSRQRRQRNILTAEKSLISVRRVHHVDRRYKNRGLDGSAILAGYLSLERNQLAHERKERPRMFFRLDGQIADETFFAASGLRCTQDGLLRAVVVLFGVPF
jgi:hypothetical protein